MKTNETQAAPIVQQESMASYCKRKRVNHLSLCDYFVKENMADTESVARLLHMYCVNSRQRIRWGVIYNASMDCGIFVNMGPEAFKDMMNKLIAGLEVDRTTVSRGIREYDEYFRNQQKGEVIPHEVTRCLNAKRTLEAALKDLIR
jgi:hypothetical protein